MNIKILYTGASDVDIANLPIAILISTVPVMRNMVLRPIALGGGCG
jgi:hypothetical protein